MEGLVPGRVVHVISVYGEVIAGNVEGVYIGDQGRIDVSVREYQTPTTTRTGEKVPTHCVVLINVPYAGKVPAGFGGSYIWRWPRDEATLWEE